MLAFADTDTLRIGYETNGDGKPILLLLHGDADGASLVSSSEGQEASFPAGYRRLVLPGVGHFPQRENPQAVLDAVLGG